MTTRDTFAAAALPVVLQEFYKGEGFDTYKDVAEEAYFMAEAMMRQKQIEEDAARTRAIVAERESG